MNGQNVVTKVPPATPGDEPFPPYYYDLDAGRVCIGVLIRRNAQKLDFWCHFKVPTESETIELMRQREIFFKPSKDSGAEPGQDVERVGSFDDDRSFFDEHLVAVVYQGKDLTSDQIQAIDPKFRLKLTAIQFLLQVASAAAESVPGQAAPTIDDLIGGNPTVTQAVALGTDEGKEVTLTLSHTFANPSAADAINFQRISKLRTMDGGSQRVITNYDAIRKLYASMVISVDGFIVRDSPGREPLPCTVSNKEQWVGKIPLAFKLHAVREVFKDADRKNV